MDWYEAIADEAVVRDGQRVDRVLMYRDIELALDHAPELAAPWALMVQYLLPFDTETAEAIWVGFTQRFIVKGPSDAYIEALPDSGLEDIRATCLAIWLAFEIGDHDNYEALIAHADASYEPRHDPDNGEFAYWFHLGEPYPRGQWNNAIMNTFVAGQGTWTSILQPNHEQTDSPGAGSQDNA